MSPSKKFTIILVFILVASSLMFVSTVPGQSLKPAVTEFSVQYVDNSYDVPTSYKYTKDLYTGETITTTVPGYRVDNKSLVASIKNPAGVDAYNFRWKPSNESGWYYQPFDTEDDQSPPLTASGWSGPPAYASDSEYTVISVISLNHISATSLDVQVQALYGEYRATPNTPIQLFEGDYYDYYFDGQASYWSNTQTVTISDDSASPNTTAPPTSTPTASPFPTETLAANIAGNSVGFELMQALVAVLAVVIAILAAVIILVFRKYHKPK